MMFEHFSTSIRACVGGIGVALLPKFLIANEIERGELVVLGDPFLNDEGYYFIQPRLSARHSGVDAFRDWIAKAATGPDVDYP